MINQWKKQLRELSDSLTTNGAMPEKLIDKLFKKNSSTSPQLVYKKVLCRVDKDNDSF